MNFPELEGKFVLAPMSGVSDVAFRVLCKRRGAAMTYTEFCSAEGLVRTNEGTIQQAFIADEESPVGIQLFGSDIDTVHKAAKLVQEKATVVDFNLGCPAWHVLSQGCGSALLAEPEKIEELVRNVAQALDRPFTVKLRMGLTESQKNFIEVAKRCVDAGAVAVTLHGRTTKQGYSGKADWNAIKELKEALKDTGVPVIGNGDVNTPEDAVRMLKETGCDYVMIGRAAQKNPFIFTKANQLLETGTYKEETDEQRMDLFWEYVSLARQFNLDFRRIKSHAMSMTKGLPNVKSVRQQLSKVQSYEELEELMAVIAGE